MNAQVCGKAFLGITSYLKWSEGEPTLTRIVARAAPETRQVFKDRIRVGGWYSYAAFAGFLRAIQQELEPKDRLISQKLGEVSAQKDLETIFRVYLTVKSPERLIKASPKVWQSYYQNAGQVEAVAWDPGHTAIRIIDFPEMDPLHCRLILGWQRAALEIIGLTVTEAVETACQSRGEPYHEFSYRWKPKAQ